MILPCEMPPSKCGFNAEITGTGRLSSFAAMTTLHDTCAFRKGHGVGRNECLAFLLGNSCFTHTETRIFEGPLGIAVIQNCETGILRQLSTMQFQSSPAEYDVIHSL